jgi:hypothetical protein
MQPFILFSTITIFDRMKALPFTLVQAFEFELAVPASDVGKSSTLVQRPFWRSDPESKSQLPLLVKLYC